MNDSIENEVARTLTRRSNDVAEARMADIAETAIRRGRSAKLRRRTTLSVASAGLVVAGVIGAINVAGSNDSTTTAVTPLQSPTSPTPVEAMQEIREKVVPCTEVVLPAELDDDHPSDLYDSTVFPEEGLLTIYFTVDGQNVEFTFSYRDDPTCRQNPELGRIIDHVVENATGT